MASALYMSLKKRAGTIFKHQHVKNLKIRSRALSYRMRNKADETGLQ